MVFICCKESFFDIHTDLAACIYISVHKHTHTYTYEQGRRGYQSKSGAWKELEGEDVRAAEGRKRKGKRIYVIIFYLKCIKMNKVNKRLLGNLNNR